MRVLGNIKKKVIALVLIVVLTLSAVVTNVMTPFNANAADIKDWAIEQALDRALALVCYGFSYGMHEIDDSVDDEAYSEVVSIFDAFLWDTEVTWALQEIEEMCQEILEEVQLIEERQTEYGSAILGRLDSQDMTDAQKYLDSKIDEDINRQLIYNDIGTSDVIDAYVEYLSAANEYGDDVDKYADKKAAFDLELDNLLGGLDPTDENRYVDGAIGTHLHNVLSNLTNAMCEKSDSAAYLTDETVMDAAAQLAYMYYPWSQDQYEFVQFELNSQVQQIALVELVYQEYLARQYDYLKNNGYLDDTDNVGARCYEHNKANLIADNKDLAERFYDYTEKNLNVSPNVSLKIYQYYKPSDMTESHAYWYDGPSDDSGNTSNNSGPIHGAFYNTNAKMRMNYKKERDGYLYDDYHGGPLDGIDDDDFVTSVKEGIHVHGDPTLGESYIIGVNQYPVVRSGGVDIYCIDNMQDDFHYVDPVLQKISHLVEAGWAGWGYGEQGFPSAEFYNRYHGVFAITPSEWVGLKIRTYIDAETHFYEDETYRYNYKFARNISEIKPLLQSDAFTVFYNGHLASYLGLYDDCYDYTRHDIPPDYLLFGDYSVSNNTVFGGTGKVTLHMLKTDAIYDAATVDTNGTEFNSHEIMHNGKTDDGAYIRDKYYAALYVPESPGTNMKSYVSAACFYDGDNGEQLYYEDAADVILSGEDSLSITSDDGRLINKVLSTSGDMVTIKFKPVSDDLIPDSIYLQSTVYPIPMVHPGEDIYDDDYCYTLMESGSLSTLSPDEDGYYTIEVPTPYMFDSAFRIQLAKKDSSVVNETNPFINEHGAYLKHSTEELTDILLNDKEKSQAKNGADVRFALSSVKTDPLTDDMQDKFEIAAKGSGYKIGDNYVDFGISKRIKFRDAENIERLPGGEVTIAMQLPDKLKSEKNREYKLLRMHNGKVDVIDTSYDKATNELTFKTDRFSTYALAYKDVDAASDSQSASKRKSPKTGE